LSDSYVIDLPIYIKLGKSKKTTFSLNLNMYRNAHFHTLNQAKVRFEEIVAERICKLPLIKKVELTYSLFAGSKRAIDIANVCCIVDKFFCDTLVNCGKLIDDNMDVISNVIYKWGEVDSKNPRVEVTLSNIQTDVPKEEPMKILLTQDEIGELIGESINRHVTFHFDQEIYVALKVNDGSLTAEVTIVKGSNNRDEPNAEDPQDFEIRETADNSGETKRRRGRPPGSKNKSQAPYGREPDGGIKVREKVNSSTDATETMEHELQEDRFEPIDIEGDVDDEDEEEDIEVVEVVEVIAQVAEQQAQVASQEPVKTTSLFNLPTPAQMTETIVQEAIKEVAAAPHVTPGPSRIFPDIGTSAPTPTQEAPPVAGAPATKSLFANLVKPVNSAASE
jgi:hypothetical protein